MKIVDFSFFFCYHKNHLKDCDKMIKKLYNELYVLAGNLFEEYENDIKIEEDKKYESCNILTLKELQVYLNIIANRYNLLDYSNPEICMLDDDSIILARMLNKTAKYTDELAEKVNYDKVLFNNLYLNKNDNLYYITNLYGSFNIFSEDVIAGLEMKYLYLLKNESDLDKDIKDNMAYRMFYINPYIEEEIITKNKPIPDYIKTEKQKYDKLDEFDKYLYNDFIDYYSSSTLKYFFKKLLTADYVSEGYSRVIELYLRANFNCLSKETIDKLYLNFNENYTPDMNLEGYNTIKRAFNRIKDDKELIKRIR